MKRNLLLGLLALSALVSCSRGDNAPRLVIITFDGLRWQELYSGADEGMVGNEKFVRQPSELKDKYWKETAEERRETLMPFIWSYAPTHGYMLGNRNKGSQMTVSNTMNFSYPGYSEMFCGWPDDARIHSNDPIPNPNVSVLEVVNQDPRYKGKVMMYSSWESIRYAVNNERGGFKASSAHEPCYTDSYVARLLQDVDAGTPNAGFEASERLDCITYGMAMETLMKEHPQVFYVGFGDTDEFAHAGEYDLYLDAIHWTDLYIRRIVEFCESDPFYKGKTTYLLTCDHGRGRGEGFRSHGESVRGSNETWFMAFGKGIPVLGETSDNGVFYTKQLAATIADILGVDFTPGNGEKCQPFDPALQSEEAKPVVIPLKAIQAAPKGKGLRYTYSEGDFKSCQDVLDAPVKASGITPAFGTEAIKQREDHFGLVFKGLLKIDREGEYILSVCTDDGSKGWMDGELLWNMDRDGGGFKDITLKLDAGYHRLEVQYFENYGGDDVEVGLYGPGVEESRIPASMLYHE